MAPLRHAARSPNSRGKGVRDGGAELWQDWAGGEWPRGVLKRQMKVAFLALTDGEEQARVSLQPVQGKPGPEIIK